jgi:hypothetical protein
MTIPHAFIFSTTDGLFLDFRVMNTAFMNTIARLLVNNESNSVK